jgi:signal transduction histidine kinase
MLIQHPEKAKIELAEIKENIDLALEDLRGIARNLNGSYLQQISINEFLQKQRRQLNKGGQHLCEMYTSGTEKNIPVQHKIILFRILQECLQNIIKHAQATEIILRTAYTEDQGL